MNETTGSEARGDEPRGGEYDTIAIEKTTASCSLCEEYAERHAAKPVAVMCCEGACLRGEIARQAANLLSHKLAPDKTARICLGGAFTKDTGQRALVRRAPRVLALEGCFIACASRMMKGVLPDLQPEVIVTDKLCDFDEGLFGVDEMAEDQIRACAQQVAEKIVGRL